MKPGKQIIQLIELTRQHGSSVDKLMLEELILAINEKGGFETQSRNGRDVRIQLTMKTWEDSPDSKLVHVYPKPNDSNIWVMGTLNKKEGVETLILPAGFDDFQGYLEEKGYQPPEPQP